MERTSKFSQYGSIMSETVPDIVMGPFCKHLKDVTSATSAQLEQTKLYFILLLFVIYRVHETLTISRT